MVAFAPTTMPIGSCSRDPIGYRGGRNLYRNEFGLNKTDPSGHIAIPPVVIVIGLYEFFVNIACGIWASEAQEAYPQDTNTNFRHCAANCCVSRFSLLFPAGIPADVVLDNPLNWHPDSGSDWNANIQGMIAAAQIDQTCREACARRLGFLCDPPYEGHPPTLPPYEPVDPYEATEYLCSRECQRRTMNEFPGPSPAADEFYNDCKAQCMEENGF